MGSPSTSCASTGARATAAHDVSLPPDRRQRRRGSRLRQSPGLAEPASYVDELKGLPGVWGPYAAKKQAETGGSESITVPA